jgi:glyoxylate/hydroxypyruvate reductase A
MIIYCYSMLDEPLRNKLSETLSPPHTIYFRADSSSEEESITQFQQADYQLGNPPVEWFENIPANLKFWQLDSVGMDQYSSLTLPENAMVANMGDWFARPCAETIVGGILALYRGLDKLTLLKQNKKWVGHGLRPELRIIYNQNAIILGAGTIAQAVRATLAGLGCTVHMLGRTSPEADLHSREDLFNELPHADVVINTLPGTASNFADAEFFSKMKTGSIYASIGRGNTTDEKVLIEALQSKQLDGAVLDVTDSEPLQEDNPLWEMDNVVLTQHTGGGHRYEHIGKVDLFLNNLIAIENGGNIVNQVDLKKGY